MEENIMNEVVEATKEQVENKAQEMSEQLERAIAKEVAQPVQPKAKAGMNLVAGIGLATGGIAAGIAIDHWVVPKISEALKNRKAKKAAKKAEKKAKAEAKKAAKEAKPAETPAPSAPTADDGIDPTTVDTTIKD